MAHLLFRLRGVPDDEAHEIRQLLDENNIEYYETGAGNWGISSPGLWLNDDLRLERAQSLIECYQQERAEVARQDWDNLKQQGRHPTVWKSLSRRPLASLGLIVFCLVLIYFSTTPFFDMLQTRQAG